MSEYDKKELDVADIRPALHAARKQIDDMTGRLAARDLKIGELTFALESSRASAGTALRQSGQLNQDLAHVTARLNAARNELARLAVEVQEASRQRDEILSSTSWRLTGPIRFAVNLLSRRES